MKIIMELGPMELRAAMRLVWQVFSDYEAADYSERGIQEFRDYIRVEDMRTRLDSGELKLWGCFLQERIVGVAALRPPGHISLLFVDGAHHRQGIARALFERSLQYAAAHGAVKMTVHSSPYAQEAYRHLGFLETGPHTEENGLLFIPMERPV